MKGEEVRKAAAAALIRATNAHPHLTSRRDVHAHIWRVRRSKEGEGERGRERESETEKRQISLHLLRANRAYPLRRRHIGAAANRDCSLVARSGGVHGDPSDSLAHPVLPHGTPRAASAEASSRGFAPDARRTVKFLREPPARLSVHQRDSRPSEPNFHLSHARHSLAIQRKNRAERSRDLKRSLRNIYV